MVGLLGVGGGGGGGVQRICWLLLLKLLGGGASPFCSYAYVLLYTVPTGT